MSLFVMPTKVYEISLFIASDCAIVYNYNLLCITIIAFILLEINNSYHVNWINWYNLMNDD